MGNRLSSGEIVNATANTNSRKFTCKCLLCFNHFSCSLLLPPSSPFNQLVLEWVPDAVSANLIPIVYTIQQYYFDTKSSNRPREYTWYSRNALPTLNPVCNPKIYILHFISNCISLFCQDRGEFHHRYLHCNQKYCTYQYIYQTVSKITSTMPSEMNKHECEIHREEKKQIVTFKRIDWVNWKTWINCKKMQNVMKLTWLYTAVFFSSGLYLW